MTDRPQTLWSRFAALLPRPRWARFALFALVLFALLRSVLWASVQPAWFAPDEDYHWLYINYLVEKGTVPDLNGPFYTAELFRDVFESDQGQYVNGPRTNYAGDPKAKLPLMGGPRSERQPAPPKPRPVLHPPGYHLGGALVDLALNSKIAITRMTAIRYYSAVLGAVTILLAYLLAAQVLAREWERLAATALASTQPILAFSASTITNDVGVALVLTATLGYCAWMLRAPPRPRQGIGLGVLLSAALFVKATMFSLVLVIGLALLLAWRTYPAARRELIGVLKWTVALPVVLVGWWYVRLIAVTGSVLGERGSLTASHGAHGRGLLHAPSVAWHWLSDVYRSYWFDYNSYEVKHQDLWFWLPLIGMAIVAAGVVLLVRRYSRTFTAPEQPQLRQASLLGFAALVLLVPPFGLDVLRGLKGLAFTTEQGRFLTPAYPGLAVIAVLAVRELCWRVRRAYAPALAVGVAAAFVFYWHTWIVWVLERFYGAIDGHWLRALRHASYDKPAFITQASLAVLLLGAIATFAAGYGVALWGGRSSGGLSAQELEDGGPVGTERRGEQRLMPEPAEVG